MARTTALGDAGLFRLDETLADQTVVGGWIVLNDGARRGQLQITDGTSNTLRPAGTGGFNAQSGTASISDGTSNTIVTAVKITSGIIAILIG
ncbi:MAG: hypothetical protein ACRDJE_06055 [Dehalococcoidia bacterium]